MKLAVWWLNERELTFVLDNDHHKKLPKYIRDLVDNAYGRAGRGRLWNCRAHAPYAFIPWRKTPLADWLLHSAGIVINIRYVERVSKLPGTVTNFKLERL